MHTIDDIIVEDQGHTVATARVAGLGTGTTSSRVATLLLHSAAATTATAAAGALAGDVSYFTTLIAFGAIAAAASTKVSAASTEVAASGSRGLTALAREMS